MHSCTMALLSDTLSLRLSQTADQNPCLLKIHQPDALGLPALSAQHCAEALSAKGV